MALILTRPTGSKTDILFPGGERVTVTIGRRTAAGYPIIAGPLPDTITQGSRRKPSPLMPPGEREQASLHLTGPRPDSGRTRAYLEMWHVKYDAFGNPVYRFEASPDIKIQRQEAKVKHEK